MPEKGGSPSIPVLDPWFK